MIKSLEFENNCGYIFDRDIQYKKGRKNRHSRSGYDEIEVDKGPKNPQLIQNLTNRKFEFVGDKINVLFGPNASGKSTIIKALANYCLCGRGATIDGMTSLNKVEPLDYHFEECTMERFKQILDRFAKNKANVEWDGNPVYCHNFADVNIMDIESLNGSILGEKGIGESLVWFMDRNRISYGENTGYFMQKLIGKMQQMEEIEDFRDLTEKNFNELGRRVNDRWAECFKITYDYFNEHYTEKTMPTILLDEIDKSLDILNTIGL